MFGPQLFSKRPPLSADIQLRKLCGEITKHEVNVEFARAREIVEMMGKITDAMRRLYRCTQCCLMGLPQAEHMKPPRADGAYTPVQILPRMLAAGAWTRCLQCEVVAEGRRSSLATDSMETMHETCPVGDGLLCKACCNWRPLDY